MERPGVVCDLAGRQSSDRRRVRASPAGQELPAACARGRAPGGCTTRPWRRSADPALCPRRKAGRGRRWPRRTVAYCRLRALRSRSWCAAPRRGPRDRRSRRVPVPCGEVTRLPSVDLRRRRRGALPSRRRLPTGAVRLGGISVMLSGLTVRAEGPAGRASTELLSSSRSTTAAAAFWGVADPATAFPGARHRRRNARLPGATSRPGPQAAAEFEPWLSAGVLDPSGALFREADCLLVTKDPAITTAPSTSRCSPRSRRAAARGAQFGPPSDAMTAPSGARCWYWSGHRSFVAMRPRRSKRPFLRLDDPLPPVPLRGLQQDLARFEAGLTGGGLGGCRWDLRLERARAALRTGRPDVDRTLRLS